VQLGAVRALGWWLADLHMPWHLSVLRSIRWQDWLTVRFSSEGFSSEASHKVFRAPTGVLQRETPTGDAISRDDVPHVRAPAQNVSGICFLYMFDFFILYALNFPPCWLEFLRVFTYHSQPRKQSRDASRGLCKHRWYNTFEHGFAHASSQCPDLKYIDLLVQGPGDVLPTV
jgi:hypothetical protein